MNILFTICGRAGSKGFKNKNLKSFIGIPLVYYSLAAIEKFASTEDDINYKIALNTDSLDLQEIVQKQNKLNVEIIKREKELATDVSSKVDVIKDTYKKVTNSLNSSFDYVVDLDITSPIRTEEDIKNAINCIKERKNIDVVFSVTESRRNPYFNMVKYENDQYIRAIASNYVSRQEAPVFFDMNASIYAYSPKALLKKKSNEFFNSNTYAIMMKDTGILDIDSEEDYELMEVIAKYLVSKYKNYKDIYDLAINMNCSIL